MAPKRILRSDIREEKEIAKQILLNDDEGNETGSSGSEAFFDENVPKEVTQPKTPNNPKR